MDIQILREAQEKGNGTEEAVSVPRCQNGVNKEDGGKVVVSFVEKKKQFKSIEMWQPIDVGTVRVEMILLARQ